MSYEAFKYYREHIKLDFVNFENVKQRRVEKLKDKYW